MALDSEQGEKTEEATQQRREDFRRRGQVAQTRELSSALVLFSTIIGIWLLGRFFMEQINQVFISSYGDGLVTAVRSGDWKPAVLFAGTKLSLVLLPAFGIATLISIASSVVQVGFMYNEEALQFRPERMNPILGFQRIFSWKALIEGLKAIAKVIIILAIAFVMIRDELVLAPQLIHFSVGQIFHYLGDLTVRVLAGMGVFMLALSAADYFFQRWDLEKEMMMTRSEVKEELKSREGDPLIKSRIRRIQREIAQRRMMEEVPKADVVVTNPTHIAVALKYDANMVAPKVVAKGADLIAEKIKELARNSNVPIVENKPLARTIYKMLKIGQTIPRELYTAVAEVLSYVYKLKKKVMN